MAPKGPQRAVRTCEQDQAPRYEIATGSDDIPIVMPRIKPYGVTTKKSASDSASIASGDTSPVQRLDSADIECLTPLSDVFLTRLTQLFNCERDVDALPDNNVCTLLRTALGYTIHK